MKQKKVGKQHSQLKNNNKGFILTLVVIIMASAISVVLISTSLSSLISLDRSKSNFNQANIVQYTEGCVHDALVQLNRNNNYTGETYNLRAGTCTISVTGSSGNRSISVTGTIDNYHHNLNIEVKLNPFELKKWD